MNAIGICGLQLYNFGQTVSIVFWTEDWKPDSFYDKIKQNQSLGLHTLCLLDIKVKEQSIANLMKGNNIYEPPRFMTVNVALQQLLECEENRKENVLQPETICIGVARLGHDDQKIVSGTCQQLLKQDFGEPLHSLVISGGQLHYLELETLRGFSWDPPQSFSPTPQH
eukprot:Sdes_comp18928_c1_seq2m9399